MNKRSLLIALALFSFRSSSGAVEVSSGTISSKSRVPPEIVKRRQQITDASVQPDAAKAASLIAALSDPDYYTRVLAARGLGEARWMLAHENLEKVLLSDPNAEVRESAAQALRMMPMAASNAALVKALSDTSENVRVGVADTLGMSGNLLAVKPLVGLLTDKSVLVRRTAVAGLRRLDDVSALSALSTVFKDSDVYVRASAIQTAGALSANGRAALPAAVKAALSDPDPLVQASALRALAASGDTPSLDQLKPFLSNTDRTVKMLAVESLGWSKDPGAKAQLQLLMKESDLGVKQTAQWALSRIEQKAKNEKK